MDPRFVIAASSLEVMQDTGSRLTLVDTLGATASAGYGSAQAASPRLGSGVFGQVDTYRYHGAAVAVKEVKDGGIGSSMGASAGKLFAAGCSVLVT